MPYEITLAHLAIIERIDSFRALAHARTQRSLLIAIFLQGSLGFAGILVQRQRSHLPGETVPLTTCVEVQ
jgi:hypothetical protein